MTKDIRQRAITMKNMETTPEATAETSCTRITMDYKITSWKVYETNEPETVGMEHRT
jgi:hypothetical protein